MLCAGKVCTTANFDDIDTMTNNIYEQQFEVDVPTNPTGNHSYQSLWIPPPWMFNSSDTTDFTTAFIQIICDDIFSSLFTVKQLECSKQAYAIQKTEKSFSNDAIGKEWFLESSTKSISLSRRHIFHFQVQSGHCGSAGGYNVARCKVK